MEEGKHAVVDLSEEEERRGGGAPGEGSSDEVGDAVGLGRGAESTEPEGSSAVDDAGHGVAAEVAKNDDLEEPLLEPEGVTAVGSGGGDGTASDGGENELHEVPKNPMATRFAFRATDANATPVSTYRGMLSRSRKNAGPTRFVSAGAPPSADPETPALSTSSSELVKSSPENASAVPDADHGASPGRGNEQDLEAAEKQSEARFAPDAAAAAAAESSHREPSRSKKQPRPERFIPEEGEAAARAKARRSGIALDRFITSQLNNPSGPSTEWEREVTAADVVGGGQGEECTTSDQPSCSIAISDSGPPEEPLPDDRRRIYSVLAVLGVSLAVSMAVLALFYIFGSESPSPPSDPNQE
ncbi:hypothetical protein OsI_00262 [Oryza sativa Indica Group]|uniref:Uncharacterized protein n=1 Tax=Oryza sativa subsp. indica TaxID=39946 RepID=A2WKB1_ORYSI|nr:hypothetical protein OsI_00262 [Oryza sativa Indica Group]